MKLMVGRLAGLALLAALAAAPAAAAPHKEKGYATSVGPLTIAKQGHFYVGGHYVGEGKDKIWAGQAYVEYQIPKKRLHPFPIVMIHGCCAAGESFTGTPDGRDGWAQYFLAHGYAVYVMDQVGRGRSPWVDNVYGKHLVKASEFVEHEFVAVEEDNKFPQAHLHTQWPGTGRIGDPVFDQFAAEMHPDWDDRTAREVFNRDAIVALLDRIGPAILEPHSQSGMYVWAAANARPHLVRAILAVEAGSSAFGDYKFVGAPDWFENGSMSKPWGLTRTPMQFSPPVKDPKEIAIRQQDKAAGPGEVRCWLQQEPARQLTSLKGIPVLLMSMEASFDAPMARCASLFLRQAGVANDFVRVADLGVHGNGHFFMLEKNNLQIAGIVADWLRKRVTPLEAHPKMAAAH
jgi:pimeloyl-ACP methyl ester carboxylesterase